jgi:hypothetical protein
MRPGSKRCVIAGSEWLSQARHGLARCGIAIGRMRDALKKVRQGRFRMAKSGAA